MRLWSLSPSYLDAKGLVAGWREALLAQKVLAGLTTGYRQHPQLERFKTAPDPHGAIAYFLAQLHKESVQRGYRFDASKIGPYTEIPLIAVPEGQVRYEAEFLLEKIKKRAPGSSQEASLEDALAKPGVSAIAVHPLFHTVPGPVASWEKIPSTAKNPGTAKNAQP